MHLHRSGFLNHDLSSVGVTAAARHPHLHGLRLFCVGHQTAGCHILTEDKLAGVAIIRHRHRVAQVRNLIFTVTDRTCHHRVVQNRDHRSCGVAHHHHRGIHASTAVGVHQLHAQREALVTHLRRHIRQHLVGEGVGNRRHRVNPYTARPVIGVIGGRGRGNVGRHRLRSSGRTHIVDVGDLHHRVRMYRNRDVFRHRSTNRLSLVACHRHRNLKAAVRHRAV